jgi:hypothetical protein
MATDRLTIVSTMMNLAILTNGEIPYDAVNPTVKELLTVANQEKKLEGPIGICGTKCDDSCDTCKTYLNVIANHFLDTDKEHLLDAKAQQKLDAKAQQQWEDEQRVQKEHDDLESCNCKNLCSACGSECVSYTVHWDGEEETHWMCERCYYYGQEDWHEYGGGLEWNESGYFD